MIDEILLGDPTALSLAIYPRAAALEVELFTAIYAPFTATRNFTLFHISLFERALGFDV